MNNLRYAVWLALMVQAPLLWAQDPGGLTSDEQQFKDSIEALNLDFETISKAKESYNNGIEFFKKGSFFSLSMGHAFL